MIIDFYLLVLNLASPVERNRPQTDSKVTSQKGLTKLNYITDIGQGDK